MDEQMKDSDSKLNDYIFLDYIPTCLGVSLSLRKELALSAQMGKRTRYEDQRE